MAQNRCSDQMYKCRYSLESPFGRPPVAPDNRIPRTGTCNHHQTIRPSPTLSLRCHGIRTGVERCRIRWIVQSKRGSHGGAARESGAPSQRRRSERGFGGASSAAPGVVLAGSGKQDRHKARSRRDGLGWL